MKKLLIVIALLGAFTLEAQKKPVEAPDISDVLKRPKNSGLASADNLVNSVFDLYEKVIDNRIKGDQEGYGTKTVFILEYQSELQKIAVAMLQISGIVREAKINVETIRAGKNIVRCKKAVSQARKNIKYMKYMCEDFKDDGELDIEVVKTKKDKSEDETARIAVLEKEIATTKAEGEKAENQIVAEIEQFENISGGKGVLWVARPSILGKIMSMKVSLDDQPIGKTKGRRYIKVQLAPGTYTLKSKAENKSEIQVTIESGKNTFVRQKAKPGMVTVRTGLEVVDEEEGIFIVDRCKPAKP